MAQTRTDRASNPAARSATTNTLPSSVDGRCDNPAPRWRRVETDRDPRGMWSVVAWERP